MTLGKLEHTPVQPLVSIIMLTYNRAEYISAAIQSTLAQTYHQFELIILDDGSTDATEAIVQGFNDARIRYIKENQNQGLIIRRAESLSYVRGVYVAILDSDDVWCSPEKLAEQVAFMESHPTCAVVGTFITLINETGSGIGINRYATEDTAIRQRILIRNQFANSSVLMRQALLQKTAGYRNFTHAEDLDLFLQLGRIGTFANIPKYYVHYRIHSRGESAHKAKLAKQVIQVIKLHQAAYPGALLATLKMYLLIVLATLRLR